MTDSVQPYTMDSGTVHNTKRGITFASISISVLLIPIVLFLAVAAGFQSVWFDTVRILLGVAIPVAVIVAGSRLNKKRGLRESGSLYVLAIVLASISLLFGLAQAAFVLLLLIYIGLIGA